MSIKGSSYSGFARAIERGDLQAAMLAAKELPRVGLDDAVRLLSLMMNAGQLELFDRSAVRWVSRFAAEVSQITFDDLVAAVALLDKLGEEPGALPQLLAFCKSKQIV